MALIAPTKATIAGTAVTPVSASGGGDTVAPDGVLTVINGGGAPITVTIVDPGSTPVAALPNPDQTVSVPASGQRDIGPIPAAWADSVTGLVSITYSAVTSVTVVYRTR